MEQRVTLDSVEAGGGALGGGGSSVGVVGVSWEVILGTRRWVWCSGVHMGVTEGVNGGLI